MSISTIEVLEQMKPGLIKKALAMRDKEVSYDDIAFMLTTESGVKVGRASVRRWFIKREAQ